MFGLAHARIWRMIPAFMAAMAAGCGGDPPHPQQQHPNQDKPTEGTADAVDQPRFR
jgi:hypothetical protein